MSSQTTNLHLIKPADGEIADIGVINSNMDIIDSSVLPRSGGTMTSSPNVKSADIDENGTPPSSALYKQSIQTLDKDGTVISHDEVAWHTNGQLQHNFAALRRTINGTLTWHQCYMRLASDGTVSYSIDTPAAFRTAIGANSSGVWDASQIPTLATSKISGLGAEVSNDISTAVSIASGAWKTLGTIDLTTGKWIVMAGVRFPSASAGYRYISLSDTSNAAPSDLYRRLSQVCVGAASGTETTIRTTVPIQVTGASWTCRANVYQNCGSALNCTGRLRAYRIA